MLGRLFSSRQRVRIAGFSACTLTGIYFREDLKILGGGVVRMSRDVSTVVSMVYDYRFGSGEHAPNAQRLVDLCTSNAGIYIKVGQHIHQLEYLVPDEYVQAMVVMLDRAPTSSLDEVLQVMEDSGIAELKLEEECVASASLAQVHVAYHPKTGEKLAVKVQHKHLIDSCAIDIMCIDWIVRAVHFVYPEFDYRWIIDQVKMNLPKELDFVNEARNSEKCAKNLAALDHVVVPKIFHEFTSQRVLCMKFEEGVNLGQVHKIKKLGVKLKDVSTLVSKIFYKQIFLDGFVHCDPHPGNLLVRKSKDGAAEIVILDHGLYTTFGDEFRLNYSRLWAAIISGNDCAIQRHCTMMGVPSMHKLLASVLTYSPYHKIEEGDFTSLQLDSGTRNTVALNVVKYLGPIATVLNSVPQQMILLLKTNDCLRSLDFKLGSQSNTFVTMSRFCVSAINADRMQSSPGVKSLCWNFLDRVRLELRILIFTILSWSKVFTPIPVALG